MNDRSVTKLISIILLLQPLVASAQPGPPPKPPAARPSVPMQAPGPQGVPHPSAQNAPTPPGRPQGPAVARLPIGAKRLPHGGSHVFHHNGTFYTQSEAGFHTIAAPVGLRVNRLPRDAKRISPGLYRHDQTVYKRVGSGYEVVPAP